MEAVEEDEEVLTSLLGTNVNAVNQDVFEQKFLTHLEEKLKEAEEEEEKALKDGDIEDGEIEEEDDGDGEDDQDKVGNGDDRDKDNRQEEGEEKVKKDSSGKDGDGSDDITQKKNVADIDLGPSRLMALLTAPRPQSQNNKEKEVKKLKQKKVVRFTAEKPVEEETELQRKIRTGEMTPFGSEIGSIKSGQSSEISGTNLDLEKYLKHQMELQKSRRKLVSKSGSKQSDNRFDEERSSKQKKKYRRIVSEEDDEDEDNDSEQVVEASSSKGKKKSKASSSKSKSALDYNILFPKKRKRKEKVGTGSSEDPWIARKKPGKVAGEMASVYLNPEDDSDYVPSDQQTSDEEYDPASNSSKGRTTRPKNKRIKSVVEKSSDEEEFSSDSDYERPVKKRSKKETDDGSYQYYLKRVEEWKQRETRLTGQMHSFSDGYKIPTYLWESLYNYQKVGVKWLWELHQQRVGGILGDEMGLGKTIQVITFLAGISCSNLLFRYTNYRGLGPSIIVCPATVMHQWVQEFHKWWPPFRVAILHESGSYSGSKKTLIKSIQDSSGIVITSYVGIVSNQDELLRYQWHYVILDEGHKIRNPDAQATLTVKQVATPHRLILSGSPLQNNLKELWSLFDFIYPGKLGTLPAFMEQFAVPITLGGYSNASEIQVATAFKCATILRDIINPYLLRRMKQDVKTHLNLPDKNEQVLFCKMTDEQRALYINYINSREIESIVQGRFNLFVGLINLRKICNHPHLFDGGPKLIKSTKFAKKLPKAKSGMEDVTFPEEDEEESDIEIDPNDSFGNWTKSGKMIVVETLLKLWHKQKHKVLLFTQSRQMLCILENFVRQQNYSYLRLDGSTSIGSRQPLIQKFNEDPDLFVFILTTRVGGLGVNLTGANRIIIFDPDWNPSTDSQARERAWRIGQNRQVTIYRLITSGTIEEKMYHRQIFKQFLTNRVLKDPRQKRFFKSNDLLELFSFNEGSAKGTESEAIFAGTGSRIKVSKKKSKKKDTTEVGLNPREKSSGKFRDVPYLVKQSKNEAVLEKEEIDEKQNKQQDEYVLQRLFSKSGVEAALRHDKIVDTDEADFMLVEREAEKVAKEAAAALKKSREQCWAADSGNVNWTGSHGVVRQETQPSKPKFGAKKVSQIGKPKVAPSATVTSEEATTSKHFAGPSLSEPSKDELMKPLSSNDLLAIIRARNISDANEAGGSNIKHEHQELFRDIRDYIAFQAMVDGQATTNEIIDRFGKRLPPEETPLFKKMLGQLCSFRRVEGQGVWRLKPEFR